MKPQEIPIETWPLIAAGYVSLRLIRRRPVEMMENPDTYSTMLKMIASAMHLAGIGEFKFIDVDEEFAMCEETLRNLLRELEEELN